MLLITALVVTASSETVIQSCECSLCTCTARTADNAAPPAAPYNAIIVPPTAELTAAPTAEPTAEPTTASTAAPTAASTTAKTTPSKCEDWATFDGNCYKYISGPRSGFKGASKHCRSLGAELVSIHSAEEYTFVLKVTSNKPVST